MLRVRGRLKSAAMPEEAKHTMILPKDLHVSTFILWHIHEQLGYGGRNHVLSQLRKRFWIINVNPAARKVLSKCILCWRAQRKIGEQKMADLRDLKLIFHLSAIWVLITLGLLGPKEGEVLPNAIDSYSPVCQAELCIWRWHTHWIPTPALMPLDGSPVGEVR